MWALGVAPVGMGGALGVAVGVAMGVGRRGGVVSVGIGCPCVGTSRPQWASRRALGVAPVGMGCVAP